jgi:hypothetical protein
VQNKSKSGTYVVSEADREGVFGLYMTPSNISVSEGATSDEWELIAYGSSSSEDDGLTAVNMIVTLPHQAEVGSHPLPSDDYDLVLEGMGFVELPNSPAKNGVVAIERYRGGRKYAMFSADATYQGSSNTEALNMNATYRHSVDTFADTRPKEFALLRVTATERKVGAVMSDSGQYVVDLKFDEAGGMLPVAVAVAVSFPNTLLHEREHALPHDEIKLNFIVKGGSGRWRPRVVFYTRFDMAICMWG